MSLENVKPGDVLCRKGASWGSFGRDSLITVDRVTKTQIVAGKSRWRKDDGYLVGATSYTRSRVSIATQSDINRIRRLEALDIVQTKFRSMKDEQLLAAISDELLFALKAKLS